MRRWKRTLRVPMGMISLLSSWLERPWHLTYPCLIRDSHITTTAEPDAYLVNYPPSHVDLPLNPWTELWLMTVLHTPSQRVYKAFRKSERLCRPGGTLRRLAITHYVLSEKRPVHLVLGFKLEHASAGVAELQLRASSGGQVSVTEEEEEEEEEEEKEKEKEKEKERELIMDTEEVSDQSWYNHAEFFFTNCKCFCGDSSSDLGPLCIVARCVSEFHRGCKRIEMTAHQLVPFHFKIDDVAREFVLAQEHEDENGLFITYSYFYDGIKSVFSLVFARGKLTILNNIYYLKERSPALEYKIHKLTSPGSHRLWDKTCEAVPFSSTTHLRKVGYVLSGQSGGNFIHHFHIYHCAHEKVKTPSNGIFLEAKRKIEYSPEQSKQCSNFSLNAKSYFNEYSLYKINHYPYDKISSHNARRNKVSKMTRISLSPNCNETYVRRYHDETHYFVCKLKNIVQVKCFSTLQEKLPPSLQTVSGECRGKSSAAELTQDRSIQNIQMPTTQEKRMLPNYVILDHMMISFANTSKVCKFTFTAMYLRPTLLFLLLI
ncbi:hypothetical protein U0070_022370 [Myodes glareolus]|uniref:Uncharacterized protein n=1 Tax=Myodes glareolus TaxID=447135 RepID=A0AAW0HZJ1_MYOGA